MGEVFRVRHERTGASYALKILNADMTEQPELLMRFRREAEVTSSLNHPNLVRVFDFDRLPDGRPYLVMELLEGRELTDVIAQAGGKLPVRRVVDLMQQMAMGLAAAHERGIVHRDLKPSNVFVTPLPGSKRELVRILDFGISKVTDGRVPLTQTSALIGTPRYMSPEQARGLTHDIDRATDQWAMAAIAYEMLAGRVAFSNDEGPLQILMSVINDEPPSFAQLRVDVPGAVEAVIRRGLSKNKAQRFESVTSFSRALARAAREAGVDLGERDQDDETALPAGKVAAATPARPSFTLPAVSPTTLRHGTGERVSVTDLAPAKPRRSKALVGVALGVGLLGAGGLAYFKNAERPTTPAAPAEARSAPPVVAAPPPSPPVAPVAPVAPASVTPAPVAPAPPAPKAAPPAPARAAEPAPEEVAKRPSRRPAHHEEKKRPRRNTEDAPKRVINEDI